MSGAEVESPIPSFWREVAGTYGFALAGGHSLPQLELFRPRGNQLVSGSTLLSVDILAGRYQNMEIFRRNLPLVSTVLQDHHSILCGPCAAPFLDRRDRSQLDVRLSLLHVAIVRRFCFAVSVVVFLVIPLCRLSRVPHPAIFRVRV